MLKKFSKIYHCKNSNNQQEIQENNTSIIKFDSDIFLPRDLDNNDPKNIIFLSKENNDKITKLENNKCGELNIFIPDHNENDKIFDLKIKSNCTTLPDHLNAFKQTFSRIDKKRQNNEKLFQIADITININESSLGKRNYQMIFNKLSAKMKNDVKSAIKGMYKFKLI